MRGPDEQPRDPASGRFVRSHTHASSGVSLEPSGHRYSSGRALIEAVKSRSPDKQGAGLAFAKDRLLNRVFSGSDAFVLKGGQALLARWPSARSTVDLDLATPGRSLDAAVDHFKELVETDQGDFLEYRVIRESNIKTRDTVLSGRRLSLEATSEGRVVGRFKIDLVVDPLMDVEPEHIEPENRVSIPGLVTSPYRVYPLSGAVADKISGTMSEYGGRSSSRVRDVVDLVIISRMGDLLGDDLVNAARQGGLPVGVGSRFRIPERWFGDLRPNLEETAASAGLDMSVEEAFTEASVFVNPILDGSAAGRVWSSETRSYRVPTTRLPGP